MKALRAKRLLCTASIALILLLVNSVPVSASPPTRNVPPSPITEPGEAVPFSHPDRNTVDPKSPVYDPGALSGPRGSRFDRSGKKPVPPPDGSEHFFGTSIQATTATYTYSLMKYVSTLSIPSGTTLYAPTMLGSNYSPLEIVTRYYWSGGTLKREIAVYDHAGSGWVVSTSAVSNYLDSYNYYTAEILKYNGSWYAMIYNFSTQQWETWYSRVGGTGPDANGWGWDIWEAWYFNETPWPDITSITGSKEIRVYVPGVGDTYVTSSYGAELKVVHTAPYAFNWISNYYFWSVNMDY